MANPRASSTRRPECESQQMADFEYSVDIARAAVDVFDYLIEYDHESEWQRRHVVSTRSHPPGRAVVGTRVEKVRRTPLGKQHFTVAVTSLDAGARRWTDEIVTGPLRGTVGRWQVDGDGARCRVTLQIDFRGAGFVGRRVAALARRAARRDIRGELDNLAHLMARTS